MPVAAANSCAQGIREFCAAAEVHAQKDSHDEQEKHNHLEQQQSAR
jgi:hypothetical protein